MYVLYHANGVKENISLTASEKPFLYVMVIAVNGASLHIDHIIPDSKGGLPVLENLRVLCRRCNLLKSDHRTQEQVQILVKGKEAMEQYKQSRATYLRSNRS